MKNPRRVVSDTSPLISLEKIDGGYTFIRQLYDRVLVPQAVLRELAAGPSNRGKLILQPTRSDLNRIVRFGVRAVETQILPYPLPRTMNVAEKINKQVRRLPEQTQAEVLDFVEYLLTKTEREQAREEEQEWTRLSLASAMRGMEEETEPEYTEGDLEERFSSS